MMIVGSAFYLAYNLRLCDPKECRPSAASTSTIQRPTDGSSIFSPELLTRFNRGKRAVTGRWHADETYINVRGRRMYLYWAINSVRYTIEFFFSEQRNLAAANRSSAWRLSIMAGQSASSLTVARPTGKPLVLRWRRAG